MTPDIVLSPEVRSEFEQQGADYDALMRRAARKNLLPYLSWTTPGYFIGNVHREMASALEAVERGDIQNLMVIVPVRHGKSLMISKRFVLWYMARNPTHNVMACSYGADLADEAGRALRNLARDQRHLDIFPECTLATDSQAVNRWNLAAGNQYLCAGVDGPIMGRGWNLGLCDDLLKGYSAAMSEPVRNTVWDWYLSDFLSRQEQPARQVFLTARWHEDDPAGRLQEAMKAGGEQWHILHYPALDENDNALVPELHSAEVLIRRRATVKPAMWNALYQGDPTPEDGDYFKSDWFLQSERRYTPEDVKSGLIRTYAASDYATKKDAGDWTVHVVVGVDAEGGIHVVDMWSGQETSDVWIDAMLDLQAKWKPLIWAEEKGQIRTSVDPFIKKRQRKRRVFVRREPFSVSKDKEIRAQTIQGMMSDNWVFWPNRTIYPWVSKAYAEMIKFPTGKHDDIVDAMSLIGRMITQMVQGKAPPPAPGKEPIFMVGDADPDGPPMKTWADVIRVKGKRPTRAPEGAISVEKEEGRMAALERLAERFAR